MGDYGRDDEKEMLGSLLVYVYLLLDLVPSVLDAPLPRNASTHAWCVSIDPLYLFQ